MNLLKYLVCPMKVPWLGGAEVISTPSALRRMYIRFCRDLRTAPAHTAETPHPSLANERVRFLPKKKGGGSPVVPLLVGSPWGGMILKIPYL